MDQYARRRANQAKTRKRQVQRRRMILASIMVVALIVGVIVVVKNFGFWIDGLTMSKTKADLKEYYGITAEEQVAVVIDDEVIQRPYTAKIWENIPYVEYSIVRESINSRVYVDLNENILLYTLPTGSICANVGSTEYTLQKEPYTWEHALFKMEGDVAYVSLDFVKEYTDFEYEIYDNYGTDRIVIRVKAGEFQNASIEHSTRIYEKSSDKGKVLRNISEGEKVRVLDKCEDWLRISTEDGFVGYVKSRYVGKQKTEVVKRQNKEVEFKNISKNYTINMAWHLVSNETANNTVLEKIANTSGLTTISPTWFTIRDTQGNIDSLASTTYVNYAHNSNLEVWACVRDFDGGVDTSDAIYDVLSRTTSRENLVNQLISEALQYKLDGINVDFELISEECGEHFIQFIRELSVKCRQNEIVLSVDNFVPSGRNAHYDLEEQGLYADYVIIMGYDEYYAGSDESGPVASLAFAEGGIISALESVPKEKLINAVPFYSRLWEEKHTEDDVLLSSTAYGMDAIRVQIEAAKADIVVDEATGHNYAEWTVGDTIYKVWLEDEAALESKLQLMKTYHLAGVAAWRLGFESQEAWELILKYVN